MEATNSAASRVAWTGANQRIAAAGPSNSDHAEAIDRGLAGLLIGQSAAMMQVRSMVRRIAKSPLAVLIEGPTGSGKELVAQSLHLASGRTGRFVPFNVCAIGEGVFEDALFGHVRGAFTGAVSDSTGFLAEADRGTVFLDEISGLPLAAQAKLLRALETKQFRPVGSRVDRRSDFRLLAATNESLTLAAADRRFREDLLFRLCGVRIELPPLTDRAEDIPALVRYFLEQLPREDGSTLEIAADALEFLCEREWPGNVRELRAVIECAVALTDGSALTQATLSRSIHARGDPPHTWMTRRDNFAARRLLQLLDEVEWNVDAAARRLGIHRATLYRRLQRIGAEPRRHRYAARSR
jgi:DNA-binding NtrC family response regulator